MASTHYFAEKKKNGFHTFSDTTKSRSGTQCPHPSPSNGPNSTKLHRRRTANAAVPVAGVRLRNHPPPAISTSLARWKFDDGANFSAAGDVEPETGRTRRRKVITGGDGDGVVSARQLAAGIWRRRVAEEVSGGGGGRRLKGGVIDRLGFEPSIGYFWFPPHCKIRKYCVERNDLFSSNIPICGPKKGALCELESSLPLRKSTMEKGKSWGPQCTRTSKGLYRYYSRMKRLEDQQFTAIPVISALQAELECAQSRICKLEAQRRSSNKKFEQFLRKLEEERISWRNKEHQKVQEIIGGLKDKLNRESKRCQSLKIVNSELINELADAKLSAKQFTQDCEEERKARELMERVCNELAKQIGEDKVKLDALKKESMKIHEEMEEERMMLQMAEVWREERVHMKLVDAKLVLEEKYNQMNKLIKELETFLSSRIVTHDVIKMREVESVLQAVNSVKIDIEQLSYVPPRSDNMLPVFEDLQNGESQGTEIELCIDHKPASDACKIHGENPEVCLVNYNIEQKSSIGVIGDSRDVEEDKSSWETVSQANDQRSSYSLEGSDPLVGRFSPGRDVLMGRTDKKAGQESQNAEISEVCSVSAKKSNQEMSALRKLLRSCPSSGEMYKTIAVEGNERLSHVTISSAEINSPDKGSGEFGFNHCSSAGQWSSLNSGNPHITRGMKGRVEWPRGIQKNGLKAKLSEARVENRKIQLRHALKRNS